MNGRASKKKYRRKEEEKPKIEEFVVCIVQKALLSDETSRWGAKALLKREKDEAFLLLFLSSCTRTDHTMRKRRMAIQHVFIWYAPPPQGQDIISTITSKCCMGCRLCSSLLLLVWRFWRAFRIRILQQKLLRQVCLSTSKFPLSSPQKEGFIGLSPATI